MLTASLLAVTTLLAPASPAPDLNLASWQPAIAADAGDAAAAQRLPLSPTPAQPPQQPPPHRFGLGGTFTMSNTGAGVGFRYWFGRHLGTFTEATWYRSQFESSAGRMQVLRISSTATYLFGTADAARVANFRPYVGGGVQYIDRSRPISAITTRTSGVGPSAFAGVELTFQEYPGLSISNEIGYNGLPRELIGRFRERVEYRLSIHMYVW